MLYIKKRKLRQHGHKSENNANDNLYKYQILYAYHIYPIFLLFLISKLQFNDILPMYCKKAISFTYSSMMISRRYWNDLTACMPLWLLYIKPASFKYRE